MDEEIYQGPGARNRPASSASSRGRYTPQSSNGSFAQGQHRMNSLGRERERERERPQDREDQRDTPGQSLLQDRLREKKAARMSERRPSTDANISHDDKMVSMSSPIRNGSGGTRQARDPADRPTSSRGRGVSKKGMGMKEMEDTVSTLHKQNFDLKLALFHSRQRQSTLEERVEAAERQLTEQNEMQAVNEQLLAELEKRDQAVEEAVGIICSLEEKVDRLERERGIVRAFDAQYENYFQSHHDDAASSADPGSSPPRLHGRDDATNVAGPGARPVVRMPSFLSEQGEGADALRSLYLPNEKGRENFQSLPKLLEEADRRQSEATLEAMNSPRLSVLSESSFLSVYGDKKATIESLDLDDRSKSPASKHHRKSLSIEKWVEERPQAALTPPRPTGSQLGSYRKGQFISLNDVLESPLQRLEKLERTLTRQNNKLASARLQHEAAAKDSGRLEKDNPRVSDKIRRTEMTAFEFQDTLPPTPDTVSTSTLRLFKTSNDTLGRDAARPYLERNNTMPPLSRSSIAPRPRSAGETINSRRDGHGWDTAAPSEADSRPSMDGSDIASTFDPWIATGREREKGMQRVQEPDLFNFAAKDEDDEWGRDMMFNHDSGVHLHHTLRNGRGNDEGLLLSDDTIVPCGGGRKGDLSTPTSPAFDNLPSPNPPQRRSSLANSPGSKLRKRPGPTAPLATNVAATYQPTHPDAPQPATTSAAQNLTVGTQKDNRRSRITSRLFGLGGNNNNGRSGSYSSPAPENATNSSSGNGNGNQNNFSRSQSYAPEPRGHNKRHSANLSSRSSAFEELASMSATPPPISRYPTDRGARRPSYMPEAKVGGHIRPMTSGSLDGSGAYSRREANVSGSMGVDGAGMAREWFGMDGTMDERDVDGGNQGTNNNGGVVKGRKWFGLGRNGSLRR